MYLDNTRIGPIKKERQNLKNLLIDIAVTLFVFLSAFVPFPSSKFYLAAFSGMLFFLCIKDLRAVVVSLCIGGLPFFLFVKSVINISITQIILCLIVLESVILLSQKTVRLVRYGNERLLMYCLWLGAIYLFILVKLSFAPQTDYNSYYGEFFFIYTTFGCIGGLLVVQSAMKLRAILLPVLLFFVCIFHLFNFTILNIPNTIFMSPIGMQSLEGIDPIALGRLAGMLPVLVFCITLEEKKLRKNILLASQLATTLIVALPILWFIQTRQAILGLFLVILLGLICLYFGQNKYPFRNRLLFTILSLIAIWASYTFLNWAERNMAQVRLYELTIDSHREYFWRVALQGIYEAPILGHGLGGYFYKHGIWPHNWLLELFYDYGILGVILFYGPVLSLFLLLFKGQSGYFVWLLIGSYWIIVAHASADVPRNSILFFFFAIVFFQTWLQRFNISDELAMRKYTTKKAH
jgi:O-antigen ligase